MTTAGPGTYYGFGTITVFDSSAGTLLPDDTFVFNGATYTIIGLISYDSNGLGGHEDLYFKVNPDMIPGKNDLVLQLDSRELAFSDASFATTASANAYFWGDLSPDLTWSDGEDISVKLCVK